MLGREGHLLARATHTNPKSNVETSIFDSRFVWVALTRRWSLPSTHPFYGAYGGKPYSTLVWDRKGKNASDTPDNSISHSLGGTDNSRIGLPDTTDIAEVAVR